MDDDGSYPEVNLEVVREALADRLGGDSVGYGELVRQLQDAPTLPAAQQQLLYGSCAQCAADIARYPAQFTDLLEAIFNRFVWGGAPLALCSTYVELLGLLVSGNNNFLHGATGTLVRNLVRSLQDEAPSPPPPPPPPCAGTGTGAGAGEPAAEGGGDGDGDADDADEGEAKRALMHGGLVALLRTAPTGQGVLLAEVQKHFGSALQNKSRSSRGQAALLAHVLRVVEGAPVLQLPLLRFCVQKMVEVDVEIKLQGEGKGAEGEEEEEEEDDVLAVFNIDDILEQERREQETARRGGAARGGGGEGEGPEGPEGEGSPSQMAADTLDRMMLLLLAYVRGEMTKSATACGTVFDALLCVFQDVVLRTHKCKFVQFLTFYGCQFDAHSPARFAELLLRKFLDAQEAVVVRQACIAYLCSFLSRGRFVERATVQSVLQTLLDWIHRFLDSSAAATAAAVAAGQRQQGQQQGRQQGQQQQQQQQAPMSPRRQAGADSKLLYAVCQGVCYIACFRGTDYGAPPASGGCHPALLHPQRCWAGFVGSAFDPMSQCLESVAREFLRVARHEQLLDEETLALPQLQRLQDWTDLSPQKRGGSAKTTKKKKRRRSGVGGLGRGKNPLDSFFPFDPYLLRRSFHYIDEIYADWNGGPTADFDDDDDDDDEDEEDVTGLSGEDSEGSGSDESDIEDDLEDEAEDRRRRGIAIRGGGEGGGEGGGGFEDDGGESEGATAMSLGSCDGSGGEGHLEMPRRVRKMSLGALSTGEDDDDEFHEMQHATTPQQPHMPRHTSIGSSVDQDDFADDSW